MQRTSKLSGNFRLLRRRSSVGSSKMQGRDSKCTHPNRGLDNQSWPLPENGKRCKNFRTNLTAVGRRVEFRQRARDIRAVETGPEYSSSFNTAISGEIPKVTLSFLNGDDREKSRDYPCLDFAATYSCAGGYNQHAEFRQYINHLLHFRGNHVSSQKSLSACWIYAR